MYRMRLSWIYLQLFLSGIFNSDGLDFRKNAREGQFPYLAFILTFEESGSSWCGGAILDETHILTAAHCVTNDITPLEPRFVKVMVGLTEVHRSRSERLSVAKVTVHPKFRTPKCPGCKEMLLSRFCFMPAISEYFKAKDDIAILTMDKPLPMGPNVQKIDYLRRDLVPYGNKCEFAGWGLNNQPNEIIRGHNLTWFNLEVLESSDCATLLLPLSPGDFCARDEDDNAMTFTGDSGSPLVCHGILVGLLSVGTEVRGNPDIFTKVGHYQCFIKKALKK